VRSCGLSSVRCNDPRAPRLAGGGERGLNHPRKPHEQGDVVAVATSRGFMASRDAVPRILTREARRIWRVCFDPHGSCWGRRSQCFLLGRGGGDEADTIGPLVRETHHVRAQAVTRLSYWPHPAVTLVWSAHEEGWMGHG
jgi:hypothetical protein